MKKHGLPASRGGEDKTLNNEGKVTAGDTICLLFCFVFLSSSSCQQVLNLDFFANANSFYKRYLFEALFISVVSQNNNLEIYHRSIF